MSLIIKSIVIFVGAIIGMIFYFVTDKNRNYTEKIAKIIPVPRKYKPAFMIIFTILVIVVIGVLAQTYLPDLPSLAYDLTFGLVVGISYAIFEKLRKIKK